ncbi:TetR/AcrR family transcriptional regulator [Streptacidiphilus fuscans]|uniref:TetR/AcrR family transcriptional regulator n=1 Tax=Streptacidiphilus fuscans TaxID=2789292 RepID=A0A931FDW2_9ACTN|nr:TetR/AcrR family transcriptional regulator [Streptacidiphilus fuscans]MBF9069993.1 TetR/AcrR family transcriptional regulator [Streptacidiphilus fuscans]
MPTVIRTARERAREELTREIKQEARRQLAEEGAQRLSLRAVARELGMASSALYRYFPSRDELLTALIMDAYNALGDRAEQAIATAPADDHRARWRALCHSVRAWAVAHPHEYALLYGTPVPGYAAPADTVAPASRVSLAIVSVLRGAADRIQPAADARPLEGVFAAQVAALVAEVAPDLTPVEVSRALVAWTQLFGMIGFELFGHLAGTVEPADGFFAHTVDTMADFLGLPDGS